MTEKTQVALCLAATWILWGSTFLAIKMALSCWFRERRLLRGKHGN
jgi:hypothetical protein